MPEPMSTDGARVAVVTGGAGAIAAKSGRFKRPATEPLSSTATARSQLTLLGRRRSPMGTDRRLTKGFLDAVPRSIELRCEGHLERVEDPL